MIRAEPRATLDPTREEPLVRVGASLFSTNTPSWVMPVMLGVGGLVIGLFVSKPGPGVLYWAGAGVAAGVVADLVNTGTPGA
jgi:hypothetical protein